MEVEEGMAGGDTRGAAAAACVRVHVGGLRTGVTAEDVEKTFSSLGRVSRVEFVSRPEGRGFAYMDFEPNSDKSLTKLFATYNGCVWKGGKLKLEKAKEHYMDRLRGEWAEAVETSKNERNVHQEKNDSQVLGKSKFMPQENTQLKIFFPRLNKVKALPFKGTGKHKYSFQRVEIPPFPFHFCDCEEHCKPFPPVSFSNSATSNEEGGIDEKEMSIMNSVMKKLFNREVGENVVDEGLSSAIQEQENVLVESCVKDSLVSENENADETDENFVMNIGMGESNSMLDFFQAKRGAEVPDNQNTKNKASTELILEKDLSHKRQKTGAKSVLEFTSKKESDRSRSQANGGQKKFILVEPDEKRNSKRLTQEFHDLSKPPTDQCQSHQNSASVQSAGCSFWKQKSSWKELIEDAKGDTFSVSRILPSLHSKESKSLKSLGSNAQPVASQSDEDYSKHSLVEDIKDETYGCKEKLKQNLHSKKSKSTKYLGSKAQSVASQPDEDYSKHSEVEVIQKERVDETYGEKLKQDRAITNNEKLVVDCAITHQNENKHSAVVGGEDDRKSKVISQSEFQSDTPGKESISKVDPQELQGSQKTPDQSEINQNLTKSTRGSSWLHRSSWTALVADKNPGAFSISQIIPDLDQLKPELPKPCALATSAKDRNVASETNGCAPKEVTDSRKTFERHGKLEETTEKVGVTVNSAENTHNTVAQKSVENTKSNAPSIVIGQVCTFMRNADSERQWSKARAKVRERLNKTSKSVASKKSKGWS